MAYYTFNIGHPATTAWWQENLARGVITAGWGGEAGDRGDQVLNQLEEGDWVLAYCNGPGFVGAGRVLGTGSYQLHKDVPEGSLSSHQHERKVQWSPFVRDVSHGIRAAKVGTHPPRQTKEHIDPAVGEAVIALLAERAALEPNEPFPALGDWKYWHVLEAVRALGGPVSVKAITAWLEEHYPHEDSSDARDNACLLSVNDANRRHHDHGRKDFRSDQGNPKDALFRVGRHRDVSYELYDPSVHGFWDILEEDGKWVAKQVEDPVSAVDRALREAHALVAAEPAPPIDNDHDARVYELRAVALREGQSDFRAALLDAYERKCAITGCGVVEILKPPTSSLTVASTRIARTMACCSEPTSTPSSTRAWSGSMPKASCSWMRSWPRVSTAHCEGASSACPRILRHSRTRNTWRTTGSTQPSNTLDRFGKYQGIQYAHYKHVARAPTFVVPARMWRPTR